MVIRYGSSSLAKSPETPRAELYNEGVKSDMWSRLASRLAGQPVISLVMVTAPRCAHEERATTKECCNRTVEN
jgi:hypothetical protein